MSRDQIFNTGCFTLVAHQFGAPVIGITSTSLYPWYSGMVGDVVTPSYVPVNVLPFTSRMTFTERVINTAILMTLKMYYKYKYEPKVSGYYVLFPGRFPHGIGHHIPPFNFLFSRQPFYHHSRGHPLDHAFFYSASVNSALSTHGGM